MANYTSIDITADKEPIVTKGGAPKITTTTWDPNKGAREAQARVEAAIQEEHRLQQMRESQDPVQQRLAKLEDITKELIANYVGLRKKIAELEAK